MNWSILVFLLLSLFWLILEKCAVRGCVIFPFLSKLCFFLTPRVFFRIGFRSRRTNIKTGSVVSEPLSVKDKQTILQSQFKNYKKKNSKKMKLNDSEVSCIGNPSRLWGNLSCTIYKIHAYCIMSVTTSKKKYFTAELWNVNKTNFEVIFHTLYWKADDRIRVMFKAVHCIM